jgi:hypothetical protein
VTVFTCLEEIRLRPDAPPDPDRLYAILMRRVAERLGLACPARACLRNHHCKTDGVLDPPCRQAANTEDRIRFDELIGVVEAIRSLTLWPEPSRNDDLRAAEALAIEILTAALPLMPGFAPKFEAWLVRYSRWPTGPKDGRFWLKLAKEEVARYRDACRR